MSDVSDTDLLRDTGAEVPTFLKANLALLIVPSVLLGVGAAMDAWVSSLHAVAPAVVSIVKGIGWGVYFRLAMRASGGVESAGFVTPIVCMVLAFVALEYGDLALVLPVIIWMLPIIDYAGMYGEGPEGALGGVLDTLKAAPGLWLGTTFALLVALINSTYAHREGAWLANLSGGVLVGPLVHVAVVFRERLFLAIHGDPA
jgi:hypothetical protein